jgi:predicted ArsR family transcriptional regulator
VKTVSENPKQSTRDIILHTIKRRTQATVDELATAANVSPVTVRHHLNALQVDGLLETDSVRRKVGRPYYVYSLSDQGHELFPKRYVRLSARLLAELKDRFPSEVVVELFEAAVQRIVEENEAVFSDLSFEDRLDFLVDLLGEEGFLSQWEKDEAGYRLIEYSCPYVSLGQEHGEVCTFDKNLIITVLQTEVQQRSCILNGDDCCEFSIPAQAQQIPAGIN